MDDSSVVTLTLRSVIPGRRGSGEPGISRLWSEIPGSPFGRPGMTPRESSVSIGTLGHAARHEAPDQDLTAVAQGPNHGAPRTVRFSDHGIVGNINPVVLQPNAIVAFL